jgi:hypothetical protein
MNQMQPKAGGINREILELREKQTYSRFAHRVFGPASVACLPSARSVLREASGGWTYSAREQLIVSGTVNEWKD